MRLKKESTNKKNINLCNQIDTKRIPDHIAIIMDGNGRWATKKGLPRSFGHNQGVSALKEIIKVSKNLGCKVLTVYAFSTENWSRPNKEVDFLINLFEKVLKKEINEIHQESIKIKFIGGHAVRAHDGVLHTYFDARGLSLVESLAKIF